MCGIVGAMIFDQSDYLISPEYINRMRDTMVNRGPDQCNHWISKNKKIGFGHRRLSIIDLSDSAMQPMTSQDGTLVISYTPFSSAETPILLPSIITLAKGTAFPLLVISPLITCPFTL